MPKSEYSEAQLQADLIDWCVSLCNHPPFKDLELIYHCPNGGSRNEKEAANLKRQGVKAGVPDLFLPVARGGYFGLYIELKVGKNKATENQEEWIAKLRQQGFACWVIHSAKAAQDCLTQYINFPRTEIVGEQKEFERRFYLDNKKSASAKRV